MNLKFTVPKFSIRLRRINLDTILALLSYLYVLDFVAILFSRRNPFIKFHAKQGLVLLFLWTVGIFSLYVPYLFWLVALFIAFSIVCGIVNVFRSKEQPLPLIGGIGQKI